MGHTWASKAGTSLECCSHLHLHNAQFCRLDNRNSAATSKAKAKLLPNAYPPGSLLPFLLSPSSPSSLPPLPPLSLPFLLAPSTSSSLPPLPPLSLHFLLSPSSPSSLPPLPLLPSPSHRCRTSSNLWDMTWALLEGGPGRWVGSHRGGMSTLGTEGQQKQSLITLVQCT